LLLGSDNRILVLQQHLLRVTTERENELMAKKLKKHKTASGKLTKKKSKNGTDGICHIRNEFSKMTTPIFGDMDKNARLTVDR